MGRCLYPTAAKLTHLIKKLQTECASTPAQDAPQLPSASRILSLGCEIGAEDLQYFENADMLIWEVARHEGFIIPDYPLASSGEARKFLAEYQVEDVNSWYQQRGVSAGVIDRFWQYSAFMARNRRFWRKVIVFPRSDCENARAIMANVQAALEFCLTSVEGDSDSTLFSI